MIESYHDLFTPPIISSMPLLKRFTWLKFLFTGKKINNPIFLKRCLYNTNQSSNKVFVSVVFQRNSDKKKKRKRNTSLIVNPILHNALPKQRNRIQVELHIDD